MYFLAQFLYCPINLCLVSAFVLSQFLELLAKLFYLSDFLVVFACHLMSSLLLEDSNFVLQIFLVLNCFAEFYLLDFLFQMSHQQIFLLVLANQILGEVVPLFGYGGC